MSQILEKLKNVDPNDVDAVKEALSTFFQNISNWTLVDNTRWLNALENVLRRFPKFCSTHRTTTEDYLVKFLDSHNHSSVINSAKCAHILQQVRPSQDKGATSKACWREQMNILCKAANDLVEVIFSNSLNIYKNNDKLESRPKILAGTPLAEALSYITKTTNLGTNEHRMAILTNRLRNVFVFIQAMLVEIYPVAKPIQPQIILQLILQSLSVSSDMNSAVDVASIKIEALRTLDALVACLGPNLIPFSALVFRFPMQSLRWSFDNQSDESGKVRCAAYSSLTRWLNVLHVHKLSHETRGKTWEDELTGYIVEDLTPPMKTVQLTMNAQPTKNLSKKARKKLAKTMLQESTMASHMPGEKNKIVISEEVSDEVAIAALECGETFLAVCGIFLKPSTHRIFQECLVKECYNINNYSTERGLHLLRTLEVGRKSIPSSVPPPTQYCLQLYSNLLHTTNSRIAKFCSQALLDIRLHLHCSPPSLNFALERRLEDNRANRKDKRKRLSEKNRAVLETLLGHDRIPSNEIEEVINITDEPVTKKHRMDDGATDQISLSSCSDRSIEISDDSDAAENTVQEVQVVIEEVKQIEEENIVSLEPIVEEHLGSEEQIQESKPEKENDAISTEVDTTDVEITDFCKNNKTVTQASNEVETIFEAKTQMPLNKTTGNVDDQEEPLSMEVGYDYSNTVKETITILDKTDEDNMQSSADLDDIQITCGQQVTISQDENDKADQDIIKDVKSSEDIDNDIPIENGIDKSHEKIIENGVIHDPSNVSEDVAILNTKEITVEDMLADFVDEVNEDNKTES
ncbi:proline-, glutamic acid- and leucine-rich protein 1 [Bombyx mori]|uniref:Pre-rRNA-processing protein RIX1 N-terminal domain-containing protein n=1 Tax=Bombyx mori TaxID=7091 RepID=A0A8R2AMQ3_BOMMO|nr:proline-, glutamic acid- and leucine-rich protein 1 [Bombyx mori]